MAHRQLIHMAKRIRFLFIALILLVAAGGLTCADSNSSMNDKILGTWKGSGRINQETVAVKLMVRSEEADLNFGPPKDCDAFAEHVVSEDKKHTYRLRAKAGGSLQGWCKKLRNSELILTQNDDGTLSLNTQEIDETVTLKKEE